MILPFKKKNIPQIVYESQTGDEEAEDETIFLTKILTQ